MRGSVAASSSAIFPVPSVDASSTIRISYVAIAPSSHSWSPVSRAASTVRRIISSSFHMGKKNVRLPNADVIPHGRYRFGATRMR